MINFNSYISIGCVMPRMPMNFVNRPLGKVEVQSSNLCGGTMFPKK